MLRCQHQKLLHLRKWKFICNSKNGGDKIVTQYGTPLLDENQLNPERLSVKVPRDYVAKVGDIFTGDITGVVGYDYGSFRISPITELPAVVDGGFKQVGANIQPRLDKLTVATYNIENFSANKKKQQMKR